MKLIRELRMGPPKTGKTKFVVESYPKPMLVLEGDEGGLDVIRTPVKYISHTQLGAFIRDNKDKLPAITAVEFVQSKPQLNMLFAPNTDQVSFPAFNEAGNQLFASGCPFRTVVIDPVTMLTDVCLSYFSQTNPKGMLDARKWASAVGSKVLQTLSAFFTLPCHVVVLMHTAPNRINNDKGEIISETMEPVFYSKLKHTLGSVPSQFFYHDSIVISGKFEAFIQTAPDSRVQGIGARWPVNLPFKVSPPTFDAIYGASVKNGETLGQA